MSRNSIPWAVAAVLLLALVVTAVFAARGLTAAPAGPTPDLAGAQTQAVATFASGLTSTVQALPTGTATNTPVPVPATETAATEATSAESPTPSCYRLKYVRDVTVPDNTLMTPAQVFTKTWEVENNGTCPWKAGFKVALFGGVAMGGSPFTLDSTVNPGGRINVSIKMVAPTNQTGVITGTWRMQDQAGTPFGDAIYVQIVIGGPTLAAPTAAPTTTP